MCRAGLSFSLRLFSLRGIVGASPFTIRSMAVVMVLIGCVACSGCSYALGEDPPEVLNSEQVQEAKPLEAFERPEAARVDEAVRFIWLVFGVALVGIIFLFIGWALYYSEPSWSKPYRPTEVIRAEGYQPTPRASSDSENATRYRID